VKKIRTLVCLLVLASCGYTQRALAGDDTTHGLPLKPERTIEFTTQEGTWMSVDVSPDGQTLAFDMLGDIYTMPITGGTAKRLTPVGLAVARNPRISPDGKLIAFVTDTDGTNQAWVMERDGSNPRRVSSPDGSKGNTSKVTSLALTNIVPAAAWTPDGTGLVLPELVDGKVGLVRYPISGGASTRVFHTDACDVSGAAAITPDGKTVYGTCRAYPDTNLITVNVRSGDLVSYVKMEKNAPASVQLSPDGK
jgi:Tol biopolymer transport system component